MLASPIDWVMGVGAVTLLSTALLAVPALIAVRRLLAGRIAAPLARSGLERELVMLAAVLGGVSAVATSDGVALALYAASSSETGTFLASFVAPAPLAAVPWFAGEVLSGSSLRPLASFIGAAAVAATTSWLAYALLWAGHPHGALTPGLVLIQLAAVFASALLAARAYLALRGEALESLPEEVGALDRLITRAR